MALRREDPYADDRRALWEDRDQSLNRAWKSMNAGLFLLWTVGNK